MSVVAEPSGPRMFAEEGTLDLRELFVELWRQRWWIVLSAVLFTAVMTTVAVVMTPIYRAQVLVMPADPNSLAGSMGSALGQIGGLAALAGVSLGAGDNAATQEALAVLDSREFIERFIADLNLMPKLFAERWDESTQQWKVPPEKRPTITTGYRYFDRLSDVTQDKKTGLITLKIEWSDPQEAANWANELVRRVNAEMRARAIHKAEASVAFLEKELLSTTQVGTRDAINRLIEAQIRQRMLASVSEESVFRVVDRALPPEPGDPVRPRKVLLIAGGPVLGFIFGLIAVLTVNWIRSAMTLKAARAVTR
jgi:uncharacterized protein involved in exopolysaccharide biosynthesis